MANTVSPNKQVKALAESTGRNHLDLQFIPLGKLDFKKKDSNDPLTTVLIGELFSNSSVKQHDSAMNIGRWIFCIEWFTEEGRKILPDHLQCPMDEGVIAGYYKDEYFAFRPIKIDKDPRKEYILWITHNIYPLLEKK